MQFVHVRTVGAGEDDTAELAHRMSLGQRHQGGDGRQPLVEPAGKIELRIGQHEIETLLLQRPHKVPVKHRVETEMCAAYFAVQLINRRLPALARLLQIAEGQHADAQFLNLCQGVRHRTGQQQGSQQRDKQTVPVHSATLPGFCKKCAASSAGTG